MATENMRSERELVAAKVYEDAQNWHRLIELLRLAVNPGARHTVTFKEGRIEIVSAKTETTIPTDIFWMDSLQLACLQKALTEP